MNSRINKSPKNIYECFLEVVRPQGQSPETKPWILQSYPSNYKDSNDERLKSVPQFTFPCYVQVSKIQHFSFVLTSIEAQWTYGFVRYSPNSDTALCILSYLPWHELFFKMLNQCAEIIQTSGKIFRWIKENLTNQSILLQEIWSCSCQVFTARGCRCQD